WSGASALALGQPRRPALLMRNGKGITHRSLAGTCGLSGDSCGCPELHRGKANETLAVMGELALIGETAWAATSARDSSSPCSRCRARSPRPPRMDDLAQCCKGP